MTKMTKNSQEIIRGGFPVVINLSGFETNKFHEWKSEHSALIDDCLLKEGALLIRGLNITDAAIFEKITESFAPKFLDYIDGNSPRTKLTGKVYTSTEYDQAHHITLHNELSYSNKWPSRIYFSCIVPAASGGETPIADSRKILNKINPDLVAEIEKKGIRYVRNLNGGKGFGPSWQETFETDNKIEVEKICREREIHFEWKPDGGIKLIHVRNGIITHPVTNEKVWFNQADQFHPSHLTPEIYETLTMMFEDPEDMPMNVTFGDKSPITKEHISEIHSSIADLEMPVKWVKGDLLIVDNVLTCHGRRPYSGNRKVLVTMS